MHVGIFLEAVSEYAGGAHTFESAVLAGVHDSTLHGRHRFTLCVPHGKTSAVKAFASEMVEIAELPETGCLPVVLKPFPARVAIRVAKRLGLTSPLPKNEPLQSTLTDVFRRRAIDVAWMIYPHAPVVDIPYVATVWDLQHRLQPVFPEVTSSGWNWEQRERHYSRYLPRASAIITGTESGKSEIATFYNVPNERIAVIPFPTPAFPRDVPESRESCVAYLKGRYQLPESYLLYPAQFWPHKNHVGALHALSELRERHAVNCSLVCVGSDQGNLEFVKQEALRLGVSDLVHFCGYIPRVDLACLYKAAEALLFPSFFGPDNLPPLEAFSLGCPVIAADVPGAREQLGDAAILVNPTDSHGMAAAILNMLEDRGTRLEMIARGRELTARQSPRQYVQAVMSVIDRLEPYRRTWSISGYTHA